MVNNNINVKNYKENSLIYFLYKKEVIVHRNLTPVIQDLKLNYIIKSCTFMKIDEKSVNIWACLYMSTGIQV